MSTALPKSNDILSFFTEATKEQSKLRLAIGGPSGSGKTFSAINILMEMGCERIGVLDTEHGSAAKYSNSFARKFKVVDNRFWQSNYDPRRLIAVLKELAPHVDGIVVDSLTHFWMGPGGMLTLVDEFAKKAQQRGGKYDTFGAWKHVDPIYNELVQTILALPCHFAAAMRAKADYEDQVDGNGKKKKVKVGHAIQMREGFEYEFDVEGMMDMDHNFIVGKTRCSEIDGKIFPMPGKNIAEPLVRWLTDGVPAAREQELPKVIVAPEDTVPDTTPIPPIPPTLPPSSAEASAFDKLVAELEAATDENDLKLVTSKVTTAHKAKEISTDEYKTFGGLYKAKLATIRGQQPTAAA